MSALALHWVEAVNKEDRLRLSWFVNNEAKIRECADKESTGVSEEQNNELVDLMKRMVSNNERKYRPTGQDPIPPPIVEEEQDNNENVPDDDSEYIIGAIMRPFPVEDHKLIAKEGRKVYLKKRNLLLPENRYYFKETTGFEHGWKMWDCAKTMEKKRHGKSAIIKQTFYRRRAGIEQDPTWYRTPIRNSPTVCNSLWD